MFFGLFKKKVKLVTVKGRKGKKTAKPEVVKKKRVAAPQIVGKVTHYFPHVKAGVILVSRGKIVPGDTLQFKGHTTDFKQKVKSMQIDNVPIKEAKAGQEIGFLVKARVRHNDTVYKI